MHRVIACERQPFQNHLTNRVRGDGATAKCMALDSIVDLSVDDPFVYCYARATRLHCVSEAFNDIGMSGPLGIMR